MTVSEKKVEVVEVVVGKLRTCWDLNPKEVAVTSVETVSVNVVGGPELAVYSTTTVSVVTLVTTVNTILAHPELYKRNRWHA